MRNWIGKCCRLSSNPYHSHEHHRSRSPRARQ